jgi:hypothetical protein
MGKLYNIYDDMKAALRSRYLQTFIEPAETRLLEICGATTITIGRIKRDGKPMTIVLTHGKLLRSEGFQKVAIDNQSVLYMNDVNHAIMIQLDSYKQDIVKEQEMADKFIEAGIRVRYIPQRWLESNPLKALQSIQQFIYT